MVIRNSPFTLVRFIFWMSISMASDVVGLLRFTTVNGFTTNDHPALCEVVLLKDLSHDVPSPLLVLVKVRRYELGADIRFGE